MEIRRWRRLQRTNSAVIISIFEDECTVRQGTVVSVVCFCVCVGFSVCNLIKTVRRYLIFNSLHVDFVHANETESFT